MGIRLARMPNGFGEEAMAAMRLASVACQSCLKLVRLERRLLWEFSRLALT